MITPETLLTTDDGEPLYRHKPRPVGFEVATTLEANGLRVRTPRRDERIPYARVTTMRLSYRPANMTSHGFQTVLTFTDGRTFKLTNLDWMSMVDVRRKDGQYRLFVAELARRLQAANPRTRFVSGRGVVMWWISAIVALALVGPMALFLWRAVEGAFWAAAAFGVVAAGLFSWQISALLRRNKPRVFTPPALPPQVLP